MPDTSADVDLAAVLVRDAAALAARMREGDLEVTTKTSVSDLVTAADHAAEHQVVDRLAAERPDDGVLGEEGAERAGSSGRRWIIDPVDGTYNFASGSDYWCSALALVDGDDLVLGAVAHHRSGEVLVGGPGIPTTVDGRRLDDLRDLPITELSAATYLHPGRLDDASAREPFLRAARLPATLRMHGSGSMDLVGVATGRLGFWFQHCTPSWDWLPGKALVEGVGGATTQVEVEGLTWSVAGGARSVAAVVEALADSR